MLEKAAQRTWLGISEPGKLKNNFFEKGFAEFVE